MIFTKVFKAARLSMTLTFGCTEQTASSGWGDVQYPIVVGHEVRTYYSSTTVRHVLTLSSWSYQTWIFGSLQIVGEAVRVGKEVKHIKVGDIVGVGAQCGSCLDCPPCHNHMESYCGTSALPPKRSVQLNCKQTMDKSAHTTENSTRVRPRETALR